MHHVKKGCRRTTEAKELKSAELGYASFCNMQARPQGFSLRNVIKQPFLRIYLNFSTVREEVSFLVFTKSFASLVIRVVGMFYATQAG